MAARRWPIASISRSTSRASRGRREVSGAVHDPVDDLARIERTLAAATLDWRGQRSDERPSGIRQVTRIAESARNTWDHEGASRLEIFVDEELRFLGRGGYRLHQTLNVAKQLAQMILVFLVNFRDQRVCISFLIIDYVVLGNISARFTQ